MNEGAAEQQTRVESQTEECEVWRSSGDDAGSVSFHRELLSFVI